jgi:hypothetical protein
LRLFHFSEDGSIPEFVPRSPKVLPMRPHGGEGLNEPLVWAIEEEFQFLYLFPRDCPRVVVWPRLGSTKQDQIVWMRAKRFRAVAFIEADWLVRLQSAIIFRYEFPVLSFKNLDDAGMWISTQAVEPMGVSRLDRLPADLSGLDVDLRIVDSFLSIQEVWQSTLHVSALRLRNATQAE